MSTSTFLHLPACPSVLVASDSTALLRQIPHGATVVVDRTVLHAHPRIGRDMQTRAAGIVGLDTDRRFDLLVEEVLHVRERDSVRDLVAIGGGTVMDAVKLAAIIPVWARPVWRARLNNGLGRVGAPREWRSSLPVVCIPTTLGTSSETNGAAVFRTSDGFSLVQGPTLVPRQAFVLEPLLGSLTQAQRRQGTWEILMRALGPFVWGPGALSHADEAAAAVIRSAIKVLHSRDPIPDSSLTGLVVLGAETQRGIVNTGRAAFSYPLWPVANEIAHVGGVSKMAALLAGLPGWVELLRASPEFGSIDRLREILSYSGATIDWLVSTAQEDAGDTAWLRHVHPPEVLTRLERRWIPIGFPRVFATKTAVGLVLEEARAGTRVLAPAR